MCLSKINVRAEIFDSAFSIRYSAPFTNSVLVELEIVTDDIKIVISDFYNFYIFNHEKTIT